MSQATQPEERSGETKKWWKDWKAIGAGITVGSALLTGLARFTSLLDWVRPTGAALSVEADYNDFKLPELVRSHFRKMGGGNARDVLDEIKDTGFSESLKDAPAGEHLQRVDSVLHVSASPAKKLGEVRGNAVLSIKNSGDRAADDVAIQCDYEGFAEITRPNDGSKLVKFSKRLELGEIKVEEAISVSLWLNSELPNNSMPILLTHSLGKQAVSLAKMSPGEYFGTSVFGGIVGSIAVLSLSLLLFQTNVRLKQIRIGLMDSRMHQQDDAGRASTS